MIWFAYVLIGWAFISALTPGAWIAFCHIVWLRQRRHAHRCVVVELAPKKGRRPAA